MSAAPSFTCNPDSMVYKTDEEATTSESKSNSRFESGHYDLTIIGARFDGPAADPLWTKFMLELGTGVEGDERTIRSYHMIPIEQRILYQKPGGKETQYCWTKMFKPLMLALGETPQQSTLWDLQVKYFSKTTVVKYEKYDYDTKGIIEFEAPRIDLLLGKTVEVDLGFEDANIERVGDSDDFGVFKNAKLVKKEGKELTGDSYDECVALATEFDIKISRLSVVKFFAGAPAITNDDLSDI